MNIRHTVTWIVTRAMARVAMFYPPLKREYEVYCQACWDNQSAAMEPALWLNIRAKGRQ